MSDRDDALPEDPEAELKRRQERVRVLVEGLALEVMTGVPTWWREEMRRFNEAEATPPVPSPHPN